MAAAAFIKTAQDKERLHFKKTLHFGKKTFLQVFEGSHGEITSPRAKGEGHFLRLYRSRFERELER